MNLYTAGMPELPEVETVKRQLEEKVVDKRISSVEVREPKSVGNDEKFADKVAGKAFEKIERRGKFLFFYLSGKEQMVGHLKMTGQLFYESPEEKISGGGHALTSGVKALRLPNKHTRIILDFADDSRLYFNDMRKFGYIKRVSGEEVEEIKSKLGIEPWDDEYEKEWFRNIFKNRSTSTKAVLLDQKRVAGLGNIYVDEACWQAEVKPRRVARGLTLKERDKLFVAAKEVMERAIEVGGTTFKDFADTGGKYGNYVDYLKVYGREGEECSRCGEVIEKTKVAGRGTHFCPGCQK